MALLACVEGCPMLQRFLGVPGRESEIVSVLGVRRFESLCKLAGNIQQDSG
jgi:hypothetical protein